MGRGRVLTAAGQRGRQCRQPEPLALCSRAQAPRAGGLGAAFRFGWGGEGSRRRQAHEQGPAACGALGDAALPRWARGAAGMRGRRCLPCGQRRCRVARRIMACRGRERVFRSGLPIREIYQRAGERGNGPHPAGDGDTRHLADRTRPLPGKTFHIILPPQTRRSTRHASLPVAENLPGARPRPAFRACLRPIHACLRPIRACLRPIRACLRPIRACLRPIPCLFTAHPAPFTTFPHLCGRPMSLAAIPCLLLPLRAFMASAPFAAHPQRLYDFPTPAYGPSAPFATHSASFAAHPAPFTTFPHLLWPLRAFYSLSAPVSVLFAPLTAIPCLFTAAFLRPFRTCLWPIHAFMAFYDLSHAICGASRAFHDFPTPFMATPCLLLPFRACFRAIRAFNSHPVPVYGRLLTGHSTPVYSLSTPFMAFYDLSHAICGPPASFAAHPRLLRSSHACLRPFCTFYGHPAPAKVSFPPFPPPPSSSRIPQGERRALPAPAQGANPLRIPFWKTTSIASVSPSPKTPQADGPCSWAVRRVYALSPE